MKRFSKQKTAECQIDVILLSRNFYAFFKTIVWPSGVVEGELLGIPRLHDQRRAKRRFLP